MYRSWPTKAELVLAAFIEGIPQDADPPDTGTLRGDLVALGDMICGHARDHATIIRAVLGELSRIPALHKALQRFLAGRKALIHQILARAADRGEIDAAAIHPELWDVLPGLSRLPGGDPGPATHPQDGAVPGRRRRPAGTAGITLRPTVLTSTVCEVIGRLLARHWAVLVAIAVIVDTLIVRSFMTPSIAALLGRWFWWPLQVRPRPSSTMLRPYGTRSSVRALLREPAD